MKANNSTEGICGGHENVTFAGYVSDQAHLLSSETHHQVGTEVRFTMGTSVPKARHNRDTKADLCSGDPGLQTEDFGSRTT